MTSAPAALARLVSRLAGVRVLVVGDVMLDRFVYGEVERISPEAPIPVLKIARESAMLGGAGNVVRNLEAIGAQVEIAAVVGDDAAGREVTQLIATLKGAVALLHAERDRRTTVKTRYVAGGQQLLRADFESSAAVAAPDKLAAAAVKAAASVGAVVISDYGKGVVTPALVQGIVAAAKGPVIVDPKSADW